MEHCAHLQLDPGPRAPLRLPLPARHGLQLRGVHVRGRQRLRPIVRQLRGRPGRLEHGQDVLHSASERVRRRDELGHGLRAAALRLQHAHRDQHLRLLGRSLPDEELGGLEQAASVQQQRGPRSCGCWAPERVGASDDFAGTKWKNLTGAARWSDGTEMVTLDYSRLTSVLWGVRKGFQARLDEVEAWQAQRGPKNK